MNEQDIPWDEHHPAGETVEFMGMVFDRKEQRYIRVRRVIHSRF